MVTYHKSALKVAEVFFDDTAERLAADVIRYQHRSLPVPNGRSTQLHTLWIDLTTNPDAIFAGMNADTRHKIRRAMKDTGVYEFSSAADALWLADFFEFYDRFAESKKLPPANRMRLNAMRQEGILDLSRMRDEDGTVLVWHAHVRGANRVRLLHSASIFREFNKEAANRISRINRLHHWSDIQRFRQSGLPTYDFGGWYAGAEDTAKLRINDFKRGFGGVIVEQYCADCPGSWKGAAALGLRQAYRRLRGVEEE